MRHNEVSNLIKDAIPLDELMERIKSFDIDSIDRAYRFAKSAHEGQARASGEPYIVHPVMVAITLAEIASDTTSIIAGLLHDVVEDTAITADIIKEMFGADIAMLVDSVTKPSRIPLVTEYERQTEYMNKLLLGMAKDKRVMLIKLADRLHNMRTLSFMSKEHRIIKSKETLELYVPLARRFGIQKLQDELSELSLMYLLHENNNSQLMKNKTKVVHDQTDTSAHIEGNDNPGANTCCDCLEGYILGDTLYCSIDRKFHSMQKRACISFIPKTIPT